VAEVPRRTLGFLAAGYRPPHQAEQLSRRCTADLRRPRSPPLAPADPGTPRYADEILQQRPARLAVGSPIHDDHFARSADG
jgi:hypothetical protein